MSCVGENGWVWRSWKCFWEPHTMKRHIFYPACLTVGPTLKTGIRSCAMGWSMHPTPNCRWGCVPFPFSPLPSLPHSVLGKPALEYWTNFCLSILRSSLLWGFPRKEVGIICIEWIWLIYIWPQAVFFGSLGNGITAIGRNMKCRLQPLWWINWLDKAF